jgi:hypothetical protein
MPLVGILLFSNLAANVGNVPLGDVSSAKGEIQQAY